MAGYGYRDGLRDGVPIGLGYLLVSTGFGIAAVNAGLPLPLSVLISASNLTSAGQVAGLEILGETSSSLGALALEMFVTTLVVNLRYSLMGISLSQKLDGSFTLGGRLLTGFFITDEIYAVSSSREGEISVPYLLGLGTLPFFGWAGGTALGAATAGVLPAEISSVFGIAIYGMFLSIVVPECRKEKGILFCALAAAGLSCLLTWVPLFGFITPGFRLILCAAAASLAAAALFPEGEKEAGDA